MIEEIFEYNKKFVEEKEYKRYITNKFPDKKIAIVSCMDTRLIELLPAALGIKNGDAKIIKNAGSIHRFYNRHKVQYNNVLIICHKINRQNVAEVQK